MNIVGYLNYRKFSNQVLKLLVIHWEFAIHWLLWCGWECSNFFCLCVTERKKDKRANFREICMIWNPDKSIHIKYHKSMDSKENQITYSCLTRAKATKQIHIGMNGTCCHVLLKYFHCNQVCFLWFPLATNSRQQHPFLANQCEVRGKISMNTHTHTTDGNCFYSAIEFVYQIDFISSASFNSHRWLPSDSLEHYGWNIKRTSAISRAIWNFSDIFFHLQLNL